MGFIEEGRQLIQDFVTPEIRSIDTRLTAVEKRLESLEAKTEKRFDSLDTKMDRVQTGLESKIDQTRVALKTEMERNHAQIMDTLRGMEKYDQLAERLSRLESKMQNVA